MAAGTASRFFDPPGLGRIGVAVARRLLPFGVSSLLYHGRAAKAEAAAAIGAEDGVTVEFVADLASFLPRCDFVVVTCALTPETRHLFDARAFALMKKGSVLVNTSRGGLVEQNHLYEALKNGTIGEITMTRTCVFFHLVKDGAADQSGTKSRGWRLAFRRGRFGRDDARASAFGSPFALFAQLRDFAPYWQRHPRHSQCHECFGCH